MPRPEHLRRPEFTEGREILAKLDAYFTAKLARGEVSVEPFGMFFYDHEAASGVNDAGQAVAIFRPLIRSEQDQLRTVRHGRQMYSVIFLPAESSELPDKPGYIRGGFQLFESGAVFLTDTVGEQVIELIDDTKRVKKVFEGIL